MDLASILTVDHIVPDMEARDHWPAVVELVDHLAERGLLQGGLKSNILHSLKEREIERSTGIGNGVAIPHAFCAEIEEVVAAFGRSTKGIEFEAMDNTPVHFVVLFIVPKEEYHMHLKTLAAIAKLFRSGDTLDALEAAEDAEQILSVLAACSHSVRA